MLNAKKTAATTAATAATATYSTGDFVGVADCAKSQIL